MADGEMDLDAQVDQLLGSDQKELQGVNSGEVEADGGLAPGQKSQETAQPKPEEIKEPVQAEAKAPEADELPDLPEGQAPHREDWKNLREKAKALKAELAELKAAKAKAPETLPERDVPATTFPKQDAPATTGKSKYPLENVLGLVARGLRGEVDQDTFRAAQAELRRFPASELVAAVERAEGGNFGAESEELGALLRSEIPLAMTVEHKEREAVSRQREAQRNYESVVSKVHADYPELKDPASEFSQQFRAIGDQLLGKFDGEKFVSEGMFPQLRNDPNAIAAAAYITKLELSSKKLPELEAELARLREVETNYKKITRPEDTTRTGAHREPVDDEKAVLDEIRRDLGWKT